MQKELLNPIAPTLDAPGKIEWQEVYPDGTKYSLLSGVKDVAGVPFSYTFFLPAGMWDGPHSHSTASYIKVLSGELRLGYGASFDKNQTGTLTPGQTLLVPGGTLHFDGVEVDTIIVGNASGVWATTYL